MSRTQTSLGDPWKNKSSPQSEKTLILHGCNSALKMNILEGPKATLNQPCHFHFKPPPFK